MSLQTELELDLANGHMHVHQRENNPASEASLKENKKHFSGQNKKLFDDLMMGEVHNGDTAKDRLGIRDMIRRYHDLLEAGILIESKVIPKSHGMIEIFMTPLQRDFNKKFLRTINK